MEFVQAAEVKGLLKDHGIVEVQESDECSHLRMEGGESVVHLHLHSAASEPSPEDGADAQTVDGTMLADCIDRVFHRLHLYELVLIPISKWRNVFDAVAFSLATNEEWQEFDHLATVELNARDPLFCEAADFQLLTALVGALLHDGEDATHGMSIVATGAPVLVEVLPPGTLRISAASQGLIDSIQEAFSGS